MTPDQFTVEPTHIVFVEASAAWPTCQQNPHGEFHYGSTIIYQGPGKYAPTTELVGVAFSFTCKHCGEDGGVLEATASDSGRMWKRTDTGERKAHLEDFGPGAVPHSSKPTVAADESKLEQ